MSTSEILMMFGALILGTQLCRFLPQFLPKKVLSAPILQKLNRTLPLVIMLLLLFTSLSMPKNSEGFTLSLRLCDRQLHLAEKYLLERGVGNSWFEWIFVAAGVTSGWKT